MTAYVGFIKEQKVGGSLVQEDLHFQQFVLINKLSSFKYQVKHIIMGLHLIVIT